MSSLLSKPGEELDATQAEAETGPQLSDHQFSELHELHTSLARDLGARLSAVTQCRVTAQVEPPEVMRTQDWEQVAAKAPFVQSFRVKPCGSTVLLTLDSTAAFHFLGGLLGGGVTRQEGAARDLTEIEVAVLQTLNKAWEHELDRAWERIGGRKFKAEHAGRGVRRSQLGGFTSGTILVRMDVFVDEKEGVLIFALPLGLAPGEQSEENGEGSSQKELVKKAIFERLRTSKLHVEAAIEGSVIRLADLTKLSVGDVIRLDNPVDQSVIVRINGTRRFTGKFVAQRKLRSLKLSGAAAATSDVDSETGPILQASDETVLDVEPETEG